MWRRFPTDPQAETRHLSALADARGFPQALVVQADLAAPDAGKQLAAQAAFPRVRGVRQVLNRHSDRHYAFAQADHMDNPVWRAGFADLAAYGLSFDLQIYPHQADQAARLAAEHGGTPLILNHAGMWADRGLAGWRAWKTGLRALAAESNVAVKISGLGMFDRDWTLESVRPLVLETLDAFGPDRAMFASNFPVDKLSGTYVATWRAFDTITADLDDVARAALFRETARRVYRLPKEES